jgi:hypothetical protein
MVVVVVAVNIMEKFILGNSGIDSSIRSTNDANIARFVHLNAVVENLNSLISKYTTIISASQLATLSSEPVKLNVPAGAYTLCSGYLYYSANATEDLILGSQQIVTVDNTMTISKNSLINLNPGNISFLANSGNYSTSFTSGDLYFSIDEDPATAPDGDLEITLYLTKLNLSII